MEKLALTFVIEPDGEHWFACVPELLEQGVSTWGHTREEAEKNLIDVLKMTLEELPREGKDVFEHLRSGNRADISVRP